MGIDRLSINVAGPTYLDRTVRVDGVLSLDGSRRIVDDYTTPGGTGLSYAIALARLGNRAKLHSALGTDEDAKQLTDAVLNESGLSAEWQQHEGTTDHAIIFIDGGNHKCVASRKDRADQWVPDDNFVDQAVASEAIVFTSFANRLVVNALTRIARSAGPKPFVMWAPHHGNCTNAAELEDVMPMIDHITLSEEEYAALGTAIGDPTKLAVGSMTVTSGKNGVRLIRNGEEEERLAPIMSIEHPRDTNGAGEAFGAGYLTAYLHTLDPQRAAATGAFLGALHVEREGSDFPHVNISHLLAATAMYDNESYRSFLRAKIEANS
jgi:sugar/nucleoside kinase (ribokinase family)